MFLFIMWQPHPDHRLEQFAARLVSSQPDHFENFKFVCSVDRFTAPGFSSIHRRTHGLIHDFDRVFTTHAANFDQLIKPSTFAFTASGLIAKSHLFDILVFTLLAHFG